MKLENKEAINLAKALKEYCEKQPTCTNCPFFLYADDHCVVEDPYVWDLGRIDEV